jgi:hypothetical protein
LNPLADVELNPTGIQVAGIQMILVVGETIRLAALRPWLDENGRYSAPSS